MHHVISKNLQSDFAALHRCVKSQVAFARGSAAESNTLIPRYHKILILCTRSMVLFFVQGSNSEYTHIHTHTHTHAHTHTHIHTHTHTYTHTYTHTWTHLHAKNASFRLSVIVILTLLNFCNKNNCNNFFSKWQVLISKLGVLIIIITCMSQCNT